MQHYTAGQSCYVPLGRHFVFDSCANSKCVGWFSRAWRISSVLASTCVWNVLLTIYLLHFNLLKSLLLTLLFCFCTVNLELFTWTYSLYRQTLNVQASTKVTLFPVCFYCLVTLRQRLWFVSTILALYKFVCMYVCIYICTYLLTCCTLVINFTCNSLR